mmetsp:Transcript_16478/g.32194  ORF Transcript_16478/g.32194 Transcript_16478/m.32194 type:complete len:136 (+) Transcript_16478:811-1218(+)
MFPSTLLALTPNFPTRLLKAVEITTNSLRNTLLGSFPISTATVALVALAILTFSSPSLTVPSTMVPTASKRYQPTWSLCCSSKIRPPLLFFSPTLSSSVESTPNQKYNDRNLQDNRRAGFFFLSINNPPISQQLQ